MDGMRAYQIMTKAPTLSDPHFQSRLTITLTPTYRSLNCLADVFRALSGAQKFIPYRSSSLTIALQDLLKKENKIILIANINSTLQEDNEDENTLKFAIRCRG
jgi:hypothetical protein